MVWKMGMVPFSCYINGHYDHVLTWADGRQFVYVNGHFDGGVDYTDGHRSRVMPIVILMVLWIVPMAIVLGLCQWSF